MNQDCIVGPSFYFRFVRIRKSHASIVSSSLAKRVGQKRVGQDRNLRKRVGQAKKGGTGPKTHDIRLKKGRTEKGGTGQDSQKKGGTAHVSHPFRVGQGNYGSERLDEA